MALTKREAEGDFECVLRDVPITGTYFSGNYASQTAAGWDPMKDGRCLLVRDVANPHDKNAVKVCSWGGKQIGWVGQKTGHSQKVAELLDACQKAGAYIRITELYPGRMDSERLRGDVYLPVAPAPKPPEPPKLAGPVVRGIYVNNTRTDERVNLLPYAGKLLTIDTGPHRLSVTLRTGDGAQVGWFRKAEFEEQNRGRGCDLDKAAKAGVLALVVTANSVMQITAEQAREHGYKLAGGVPLEESRFKLEDHFLAGHPAPTGPAVTGEFGTRSIEHHRNAGFTPAAAAAAYKEAFRPPEGYTATSVVHDEIIYTPTQPPKETTMSKIAQTATAIINTNKSAAGTAAYMEAGRLANNQAAKLAAKHLPFMIKGYADTPIGKLVIANIAQAAVKQLRPNDSTLNELTEAMIVQAFQSLYQVVDLDGILDSLTSSPEMTRAIGKVKASRSDAHDD